MKYFIIFIITLPLFGADIYDTNSKQYRKSVDTLKYIDKPGVLINPDMSAVAGVPRKYWKVQGNALVQMDLGERNAVDATHQLAAQQRQDEQDAHTAQRPKQSEINALKAKAVSPFELELIALLEKVIKYQRVNVEADE